MTDNLLRARFGKNVRAARKTLSITQTELARRCECSPNQIGHIEAGRHEPSLRLYFSLCRELKQVKPPLL